MATILDIFRSYAGDKLIERSAIISGLQEEKLFEFFASILPAIVVNISAEKLQRAPGTEKLIDFLETSDLPDLSSNLLNDNFKADFIEKLKSSALTSKVEASNQDKLFSIAVASVFILIKQIHANKTSLGYTSIKRTLLGIEQSAVHEFVECVVKNKEGAHLIDNPNKIALGDKHDDSDQSILGGYAGGR